MKEVKQDLLFWQREVYERVRHLGKGNTMRARVPTVVKARVARRVGFGNPSLPSSGPRMKGGKQQQKGGKDPPGWPSNWARNNFKGIQFCRDYHVKKSCPGNCGRSLSISGTFGRNPDAF